MKILVLGAKGMLGKMFYPILGGANELEDLCFVDKDELDICDETALRAKFEEMKPDYVLNCAAYTDVDGAEENRDLAFSINANAVGNIAKMANEFGSVLIHFSTDYVFDGKNSSGYLETDKPNPINVYGESKLAGEILIQKNCERYYIVRTAWLYGPFGGNFVNTMLKLFKKKEEISVVNDQIGSPTYAYDLAEAVANLFFDTNLAFGVYHLTGFDACTWYDLAIEIRDVLGSDVKIMPVKSSEFERPARRPKCSVLRNTKLDGSLRPWKDALREYLIDFS